MSRPVSEGAAPVHAPLTDEVIVRRRLAGPLAAVVAVVAVGMASFHLYTAGVAVYTAMVQRSVHLAFTLVLIFLLYPATARSRRDRIAWFDWIAAALSAVGCLYITANWDALSEASRIAAPNGVDLGLGILTTLLVLEATRRTAGLSLPLVAVAFVLYGFAGPYMPGALGHPGISLDQLIGMNYLVTEGLFGSALGVSSTIIVVFIIFGAVLEESGGGRFFIELASSAFGAVRGGPAKISIVASGFFGMISGSAVANVAAVGTFTIPLIKRVGYGANFAAAVEAVASTGGLLMPPIMGAAAFIMAELLGVSYLSICLAAAIPALLYYLSLYASVDLEARKGGMLGIPPEDRPHLRRVLRWGGHLLIPPVILVYLLAVVQWSAVKVGFYTVVATIVVAAFGRQTRMNGTRFLNALRNGAIGALQVAAVCACAGIVATIVSITGLGLNLSSVLIDLAQGQLWLLLVLTMLASLVLGMGLPATPCYIILAVLAAPAITQMGVPAIAAHLFVFYYGCLSAVTPPVAVAAYAAAAVAETNPMRTGWTAWRLSLVAYIVPFMFVYGPELLMIGTPLGIGLAAVTSSLGVILFAASLQGHLRGPLTHAERGTLVAAALLLIVPGLRTDIAGAVLATIVFAVHGRRRRRSVGGSPTMAPVGVTAGDVPPA